MPANTNYRNLADGEIAYVQGSARDPYQVKNVHGVYSCSCPAWKNQRRHPDQRTCKHICSIRGADAEAARIGQQLAPVAAPVATGPATRRLDRSLIQAVLARYSTAAECNVIQNLPADSNRLGQNLLAECNLLGQNLPCLLAEKWDGIQDPTGHWISEKLDGVRAWWDGHRFISRLGNELHAPEWFKAKMPQGVHLDGELFIGRKQFQETVSVVRTLVPGEGWRQVKFMVFDAPKHGGTFEERYEYLREVVTGNVPEIQVCRQSRCNGIEHIKTQLAQVEANGGEGLMLRQPASKYESRRSTTLLKVKTRHDMEARVVGITQGKGRHRGVMGAVICEMPDGQTFSVGSGFSDEQRSNPPTIGSRITYSYQELTDRGVPRFPTFLRMAENQA